MTEARTAATVARRSIWRSKVLIAMASVTLIGVALWVYAAVTRPAEAGGGMTPRTSAATSLASGLAPTGVGDGVPEATAGGMDPRLVDEAAPAVARFGGSFIAGFCVAYAFRKMIKVAALVTGVVLIAMFALDRAGVIEVNTGVLTASLERGAAWVKGEAGAMKEFVLGYLPSAGAGVAGMVMGLRNK